MSGLLDLIVSVIVAWPIFAVIVWACNWWEDGGDTDHSFWDYLFLPFNWRDWRGPEPYDESHHREEAAEGVSYGRSFALGDLEGARAAYEAYVLSVTPPGPDATYQYYLAYQTQLWESCGRPDIRKPVSEEQWNADKLRAEIEAARKCCQDHRGRVGLGTTRDNTVVYFSLGGDEELPSLGRPIVASLERDGKIHYLHRCCVCGREHLRSDPQVGGWTHSRGRSVGDLYDELRALAA